MTIVKFDSAMVAMRDGVYNDHEYSLYDATGNSKVVKGGYCICDNGYLRWPTMMAPSKVAIGAPDYNWSEMLESLRKDIECLFGQMKQEFAILKYDSRFNSLELMDNIFLTCCAGAELLLEQIYHGMAQRSSWRMTNPIFPRVLRLFGEDFVSKQG
jgi:Plant transposon protein